ncbi:MAG: hypothetical protein BWY46_00860 [Firmicutes bacterium ADurb.Bin300]|jgi:uncharacterized beta-barrel protein YwiB (DUF1934 family)|nr:MAG: hypothetical protein BWY46_00860 [Firmicutes bacterium ADurb.Bin300]HOD02105.1 DUF1934 domain-containing protein [Clostridiales bacterium]
MKKDVLIKITDEQFSNGETEKLEIMTKGTLSFCDDEFSIMYNETDGGLDGSVTTLLLDSPTCVTMRREGPFSSQIILEQNKRHSCYYDTPYGSFMMGVFAKYVRMNVTEKGGTLKMSYTVDFNSDLAAENKMLVTVTEI